MEAHESGATGQRCPAGKEVTPKEKLPLQRRWASEPSAAGRRNTFADLEGKNCENLPSGATGGAAPQQKYVFTENSGTLLSGPSAGGAMGGPPLQDPQDAFAQGFPRGFPYQLGHSYPQHPQTEHFASGAKPQPGLEPHAWPFAGQLPSDDLYPMGHTHQPHGAGAVRFHRQKSPSLPSSFGQYSQSGAEPVEEGYCKKDQKPKKPGKYKCNFCGRACAKPSVLKKHIRSHTGERPYPCEPCGFSFKTKSNLYKHRKSHAHAIKARLAPFPDLALTHGREMDQASPGGEAEVHSDGDQSTDTDEEGAEGPTMLTDKDSPIPEVSFETDKSAGGVEPAYADSAEDLPVGSMKVPILIVPKPGGVPSASMEFKGSHHMLASHTGGRAHSLDDCPTIKQRLALRLNEKKGQDYESVLSQSLNLLSPHSKGSTDSGYFSRSESAEQQISPPNTNAKSYEEIMFGRTWYYGPNSRSRQSATVGMAGTDPIALAGLKQSGAVLDIRKIAEGHIGFRGDVGISGDPKHNPTGPCQSSTGLLEPPSDSGILIRSNSMPTSSPPNLSVPPGIRGSHSFDEMMTSDDVFYPPRCRLRRQTAFEHSTNEAHVGEAEGHGHKNVPPSHGMKIDERNTGVPEYVAYNPYGTKVSMSEIATRKRRKENSVGDEEEIPRHCDSSCSGSVEIVGDYDFKQGSVEGSRATPTGKGSLHSAHSQSDSFDTCASMNSEDIALFPDSEGRKTAGNVISVIQHTNSLSRPNSFEKSESFEQQGHHPFEKALSSQCSEQSDTEIYEDALSPESILLRTESMEQQLPSDSELASLTSSGSATLPGQPYHIPHKLVRQPNIQVPEIRVTEEPDKPEKEAEAQTTVKDLEKQHQHHVEEFQLPQRSDTLSQMPSEKLPPKKKRLRLTDMEHSSGESSFESTCTSLSRSPSQESNLSHSSSFSMSFDRDEGLKSISPTKQDDSTSCGVPKQSEFLTVPGSAHSSHHQQREMRRSSSEQAPCTLPTELTEMRSKSFDYGNLPSSRQGEVYSSASAMKERRRGYLVRQPSLSVYPETITQEGGVAEMLIKQESLEHLQWPGSAGSCHSADDLTCRSKRVGTNLGGLGTHQQHHQHFLQQSMSEDSLQDEPLHSRFQQHRLQAQGSSSEGEYPGQEIHLYPSGTPYLPFQQGGLPWSQEMSPRTRPQLTLQAQQQLQKLHIRTQSSLPGLSLQKQQVLHSHQQQIHNGKPDNLSGPKYHPTSMSPRTFPLASKHSISSSTASPVQIQPVFATQSLGSQASVPGLIVPVRIQTHVPSFGSIMYTSVSQLVTAHDTVAAQFAQRGPPCQQTDSNTSLQDSAMGSSKSCCTISGGMSGTGFNLAHFLGQTDSTTLRYTLFKSPGSLPEQQLNTGIPLSLTSGTISTTDASSSTSGGGKRMLSPASSLELFFETNQQKRVKEERMYGQILREMSAVELSGTEGGTNSEKGQGSVQRGHPKSDDSIDDSERMASSPPLSDFIGTPNIAVPVHSSAPHLPDVPRPESFTPPLQIVTDLDGQDSPEELHVDQVVSEPVSSPQSGASIADAETINGSNPSTCPVNTLVKQTATRSRTSGPGQSLLLTDVADMRRFLPSFPSLRTTSRVSWCFLNYTKPSSSLASALGSVYSSWSVSSYDPNPLGLSTKATLALLRSKQKRNHCDSVYATAATSPPSSGKLVSSVAWKLRYDQLKPELMPTADIGPFERKMKGVMVVSSSWDRSKEEHGEKNVSVKQTTTIEPTRIKIFEGGYKSNEDYVYVRGRGRGKYICEECGIRCKKPSMLKKHIRTHTDVRPYVCKFCNFAFKTKGNLTKHMKSKAHMKKCLELGVSTSSVEDNEGDDGEAGDEGQRSERSSRSILAEHQFSDADDSDGVEEDGEEDGEEEEEEEDYDGDSTPLARSRSASPQPFGLAGTTTATTSQHAPRLASELLGRPPPFGYFTTVPSIRITPQAPPTSLQGAPRVEDLQLPSPDPSSSSSGCPSPLSPGSSPSAHRYLSPHRDLSPHLSPRRHPSPKRELGVSGGFRRDSSPRRGGHLSLLSPLSRPSSPAGRDYKRDLSPRGRPRGLIRPLSPRRGLHPHLHHLSQQGGTRTLRPGHQSAQPCRSGRRQRGNGGDMETESPGSPVGRSQGGSSPPRQVLFSHLPLHSQVTVRSLFPMIPIGGIQMVHASVPAPLGQQGAHQQHQGTSSRLLPQESTLKNSAPGEAASPHLREQPMRSVQNLGGVAGEGARAEPEESVNTCTEAIASLCIASEELAERGSRSRVSPSPSPFLVAPPTDSRHQQRSPSIPSSPPSPPPGPVIQHFSSPEPHTAEPRPPSATSNPVQLEKDSECESKRWSKRAS